MCSLCYQPAADFPVVRHRYGTANLSRSLYRRTQKLGRRYYPTQQALFGELLATRTRYQCRRRQTNGRRNYSRGAGPCRAQSLGRRSRAALGQWHNCSHRPQKPLSHAALRHWHNYSHRPRNRYPALRLGNGRTTATGPRNRFPALRLGIGTTAATGLRNYYPALHVLSVYKEPARLEAQNRYPALHVLSVCTSHRGQ